MNQPNKIEHFLKPIVEAQKGQKESKHSQEFSEEIEKPKEKEKEKKRVQENEKLKEKEKEKEKEKQQPTHSTSQSLRFPEGHRILERKPTLPDKPKPEEIRSIVSPNSARESRDLHKNSDINLVTLGNILPKHATNSTNSGSKKPKYYLFGYFLIFLGLLPMKNKLLVQEKPKLRKCLTFQILI